MASSTATKASFRTDVKYSEAEEYNKNIIIEEYNYC